MKRIIAILMSILLILCLTGCCSNEGPTTLAANRPSYWFDPEQNIIAIHSTYFDAEVVEDLGGGCYIIRDKHTNVLYLVASGGSYGATAMTPIYNSDGTLKLYED